MKVKVSPGWQLAGEDNKLAYEGEILDVPEALAAEWISAGQAVAVKAVTSSPNKAVTSSPNKAADKPQVFTGIPKRS